jgi:hypothetical protein
MGRRNGRRRLKMEKIYVFEGRTQEEKNEFLRVLKKVAFYTEDDFTKVSDEDRVRFGGESKIIINTFARFVVRTIADAKIAGRKPVVLIDDFASRIDEAFDVSAYIKPLFDVSMMIIYFAEHKSSVDRLRESGLTVKSI